MVNKADVIPIAPRNPGDLSPHFRGRKYKNPPTKQGYNLCLV